MAIIGKSEFLKLNEKYRIIHPFDMSLMDGDGYVLTVKEDVTINYLEHLNLVSKEIVFVPPGYVAHLTAKSRFGRMGLSFLNAAKVHSGFIGRLALEVVNLSNDRRPITIRHDDPFMHFELVERKGDPSPYMGKYMFQFMTDHEIAIYFDILEKELKDVYDLDALKILAKDRVARVEEI
jgi:dCTP deaminase